MTNFRYQALDADHRPVKGELDADNVQQAIWQLESGGLTVQSIGCAEPMSPSIGAAATSDRGDHETSAMDGTSTGATIEHKVLQSHMATILEEGKAIVPALLAYAEEMPPGRRRRQLHSVIQVLHRGDPREAVETLRVLPEYWIPLLSAATSSCDPGHVLREFLEESQRAHELRRQWRLSLAYPLLIASLAGVVLTMLSFFVIPIFREMCLSFGIGLPLPTDMVFTLSSWITSGKIVILFAIVLAVGSFLFFAKRMLPRSLRDSMDHWLDLPRGRTTAIARFAHFTADLLDAGLDIPNALRIAGFTTRRPRLRNASWHLANAMEPDHNSGQPTFPYPRTATILHALHTEMPTRSRIHLLREISDCHANQARMRLSWTCGIIEPIAICVLGLLVGGTVLALFLPLISLVKALG